MPAQVPLGESSGIAFLVSAGIVYEIIAAACSSPQTTEINADTRADTLMKWVHIGIGQAAVFIVAAAVIERRAGNSPWPVVAGGSTAAGLMYVQYLHARKAGLADGKSGTESTSPQLFSTRAS